MNSAAVSYVERSDGRILCVWNSRYGGWTLPGGKVEEGETVEDAQARELYEETGLYTSLATPLYLAETCVKDAPEDRGRMVHVFRVEPTIWHKREREMEPGHPVTWFTREEFLRWSPFAEFYVGMFETMDYLSGVKGPGYVVVDVYVLDWDLDIPEVDNTVKNLENI